MRTFENVIGWTAKIQTYPSNEAKLTIYDRRGNILVKKWYKNQRGARIALGKYDKNFYEKY